MSLRAKLTWQCLLSFVVALITLFVPAGTIHYWQGWVYLFIIFIPMVIFSVYFYKRDPALVERRMRRREKETAQKVVMKIANIMAMTIFIVPGLDYRFGWSKQMFGAVPMWLEVLSIVVSLISYLATMYVMEVNRFAGRTVQVEAQQQVVSMGPYRIVRHPMYSAAILMVLFTPLALGSYVALPFCVMFIPLLVVRILNEEKVLRRELPGYAAYCEGTKYRVYPYIW